MICKKTLFLRLLMEGKFISPRCPGQFMTTTAVGRLLGVASATVHYWITKHSPEWAAQLSARGTKTKAALAAIREEMIAILSSDQKYFNTGRLKPCYLLAEELSISPTTLMKWAMEDGFHEVVVVWKRGHCNPYTENDDDFIEAVRAKQKAAVRRKNQYKRRANTRRINHLRKQINNTNTSDAVL